MLKQQEQRYSRNLMRLQVRLLDREMQQEPHRIRKKILEPLEPPRQPEQNYIDLYSFHGDDSEIHCNHHRLMHNRLWRMEKPLREKLQKQQVVIQWQEPHHIRKEMVQQQELHRNHKEMLQP